jgi:hypothetical protein
VAFIMRTARLDGVDEDEEEDDRRGMREEETARRISSRWHARSSLALS